MLTQQIHLSNSSSTYLIIDKPSLPGINHRSFRVWSRPTFPKNQRKQKRVTYGCTSSSASKIKAMDESEAENKVKVKATITVGGFSAELGKSLLLQLVSTTLDPKTKKVKYEAQKTHHDQSTQEDRNEAQKTHHDQSTQEVKYQEVKYEAEFEVPESFGEVGAVLVENEHHKEMFVKDIVLEGFILGPVTFSCNSWVQYSKDDNPVKRVFFSNKLYLPSETPEGVKSLRKEELELLRGNGQGERKSFERIYDYDVYNDLGDPDSSEDLKRPVLGGRENPYPRRCRTGRPRCDEDPLSEKRSNSVYVPRDEAFSEVKQLTFSTKTMYSAWHALIPTLENVIGDKDVGFPVFSAIDELFHEGLSLRPLKGRGLVANFFNTIGSFFEYTEDLLRFEPPSPMDKDRFFWLRDEEFGRQTLAGLNPCCIQLVTEWPLKSKLDANIYGPAESAITSEIINREIGGIMSVEKAIEEKKLFMLDYHDLLLPYVNKVRKLPGTTLYGSRTLFFLNPEGTLRPLAIELTRPPTNEKGQWKQVFTPSWHSTSVWLWRFAKAHVLAHDSGYHQLVSHWLRTHCVTEPYVIATNRHLSVMHPINKLLHPHFRYTMKINARAREALINADGIIESSFSPGKYSIEISSAAYALEWRFDTQSLPADLIRRGIAEKDPFAPHGLKLTIQDYPFANDGLILWDAIEHWVTDYVNRYYPKPSLVNSDDELQAWWTEIRTCGHADKKDEPWWPQLRTPKDLIEILSTIIWVTSGHHAAVNFGQYAYGGYFPNRPTITRTKMPSEDPTEEDLEKFVAKPEKALLKCFPSQLQATRVMAVLDILSTHSPDEEYIGEKIEPSWAEDPVINAAFERFSERLKRLEAIINERNENTNLKNRNGAGIVPYELLKPFSKPGVTGMGVPCSISI